MLLTKQKKKNKISSHKCSLTKQEEFKMQNKALYFRGICKGANLPLAMKTAQIVIEEDVSNADELLSIAIFYLKGQIKSDEILTEIILQEIDSFQKNEFNQQELNPEIEEILKLNKEAIYICGFCDGANLPLTKQAAILANHLHEGQKRNDGRDYINHPLEVCRYLINLGIKDDVLLAATLLHDAIEEKHIIFEKLKEIMGKKVANLVLLATKLDNETNEQYYNKYSTDVKAVILKAADRTSNVSDMIKVFSVKRLEKYVSETEEIILPLMKEYRKMHLEYSDLFIILRDRISSVLLAVKEIIKLRKLLNLK